LKLKLNRWLLIPLLILCFTPLFIAGCAEKEAEPLHEPAVINETALMARTGEEYFSLYDGENWSDKMIKGVNVGTSLPARWYTEFPADRELYHDWLEDIAAMNANTVRVYTLLDPAFYTVLAEYNEDPDNEPIYLMQEIWPHDDVPDLNFYDREYLEAYEKEIKLVIDALHGNADIPARPYRAYGNYSADVSPYLLGILIGRELEPDEVEATDEKNPEKDGYAGDYVVAIPGEASPTETWIAEMCDLAMAHSTLEYGWQYPVGFVSWPTLDPLDHKTEYEADGTPGYNIRETVDPNIFSAGTENEAGFFGAYHIYPNYPDFMNNEPAFAEYEDEQGTFRYKGYLTKFMEIHPPYPALVAEFGISTSLNTSHKSPDGLHHGGLDETDQGEMTVRMMRSIVDTGYAGGIIFEWTDEWAKKTWNTEPFMVPWERQVLWQNAMCPEQNYGIMAVEPGEREDEELFDPWLTEAGGPAFAPLEDRPESFGKIKSLEAGADEAYLHLNIEVDRGDNSETKEFPWEDLGLVIGIDTGFSESGEFKLPLQDLPELPGGTQFMLHLASPDKAELLAVPSYNRGEFAFEPEASREAKFTRIETLVNRERVTADGRVFEAIYSDESSLKHGEFNPEHEEYDSLAHWHECSDSGRIYIRLPWMLLNVSDPSGHRLLHDESEYLEHPARDELSTTESEGFIFYPATYSKKDEASSLAGSPDQVPEVIDFEPRVEDSFAEQPAPYRWEGWEEPESRFRLKESYQIIAEYFAELD